MKEEILTAKEWLRKGFAPVKNLIADEDGSIQQEYFEECMERYANYKNRILEDRIKEFREELKTTYYEQGYFRDWAFNDLLLGYDKHFNIKQQTI